MPEEKDELYVVMSIDYEYNDQYFYRTENGGGSPLKAFRDKEKAKLYMNELNDEFIKEYVEPEPESWSEHGTCDVYKTEDDPTKEKYFKIVKVSIV